MNGTIHDGDAYAHLLEAAVRREMDVLGDGRAVELANEVDGLAVEPGGAVTALDRSGEDVLRDLVEIYTNASGEVAAFVIARKLENVLEESDPMTLPENVSRHI
jgi:hypothetical protein